MSVQTSLEYVRGAEWAPWDQYTATWASASNPQPAIGNGSITAKYRRVGVTGYLRGAIRMGTNTTFGTGWWSISMPTGWVASNTPASVGYQIGNILMVPTAGSGMSGFCWAIPNGTALQFVTNAATPLIVTATAPASWTQNAANFLSWNIVLELAS